MFHRLELSRNSRVKNMLAKRIAVIALVSGISVASSGAHAMTHGGEVAGQSVHVNEGGGQDLSIKGWDYYQKWGTSWSRAKETVRPKLKYSGYTRAKGNVIGQKRVIETCVRLRVGSNGKSRTACSSAKSNGRNWVPGTVKGTSKWRGFRSPAMQMSGWTTRISKNIY